MLITLIVMGITFLPLMNMFTGSMAQSQANYELTTARYIAQEAMEKLRNNNLTVDQIIALGDIWDPPLDEKPIVFDRTMWRVYREIDPDSKPLKVSVQIYREEDRVRKSSNAKPLVEVLTLMEDFQWDSILQ